MPAEADDEVMAAAWAYAIERCGFVVWEGNREMFGPDELAEWDAAVAEYLEQHGGRGHASVGLVAAALAAGQLLAPIVDAVGAVFSQISDFS